MAKWGEGDPRWIVEERPDATNVNNWHWSEKNADSRSKSKLESLLLGLVVEDPHLGRVDVLEMESLEGEARVNNRKSKLIFLYEWNLKLKWEGRANGEDKVVKGQIHIPNLSEEHTDIKDVDLEVTLDTDRSLSAGALKEMMRVGKGAEILRERLAEYVTSLRNEFSKGLILPGKEAKSSNQEHGEAPKEESTKTKALFKSYEPSSGGATSSPGGVKLVLKDISLSETFTCSGEELYNVLTQKNISSGLLCLGD
uniref:Activator of 90 kDa heat shock protein ATPase homolog 1 n=1 Tax=Caligus clemensi TaxID=344056 RepID=C1C1C1_CALCM|nr:Activator of 90 kDa heat shock protein ATPase homolog 1 [Caligus clemensi]